MCLGLRGVTISVPGATEAHLEAYGYDWWMEISIHAMQCKASCRMYGIKIPGANPLERAPLGTILLWEHAVCLGSEGFVTSH